MDSPESNTPPTPMEFEQFFAENFAEKLEAERAQEQQWQEEAFAGCTHTVCGLELRGMSAYDLLVLTGCENPFVAGGSISPEAIAQFLVVLAEPAPRGWFARRRFFRQVGLYDYAKAVAEIKAYVERMFVSSGIKLRSPASVGAEGTNGEPPLNLCFLAPLVVQIAAETGWAESHILSMRIDKLFQYRRAIELKAGSKPHMAPSERLISQALGAYDQYMAALADTGNATS